MVRIITDDYGLDYFAAFAGCSTDVEASFDTIIFLANKLDELGLGCIMVTESSDKKIAQTIRENTTAKNQEILVLHSMQSTTDSTYLSVMESNLAVLKDALD